LGRFPEARRPRLHLDDVRRGHFRGDHIAFLDIFVLIFFIQNHDVTKRPDNQPLCFLPPAAALVPPCELHALLYGVVALPFLPASAALFAETFERNCIPRGKLCAGGKAPTWRALLHVSLGTDPILIVIAVVIVIAVKTATA
jgi:hypothetical protein